MNLNLLFRLGKATKPRSRLALSAPISRCKHTNACGMLWRHAQAAFKISNARCLLCQHYYGKYLFASQLNRIIT